MHRHMYVLPVAAWILESGTQVIGPSEAMAGLLGRADRTRVIEALARLTELGALRELPRAARKNAPRAFERVADPYWGLVETYVTGARTSAGLPDESAGFVPPGSAGRQP